MKMKNTESGFIWLVCLLPFLGLGVGMAGNKLVDSERRREQKSRQNRDLSRLEYEAEKVELEARIKRAKDADGVDAPKS